MGQWIEVGRLDDIPRLGARLVHAPGAEVAVFRTRDDAVFALLNRCPHKGGPLSEGIVSGRVVVCPLHSWTIDLETGEASPPDEGCTRVVAVRLENGVVWLDPSGLSAQEVKHG